VTTSRFLPVLNLVGCLLITVVIVAQWFKERGLVVRIETISHELVTAREQTAGAEKRAAALERDVLQLKESIEATALARREAEEAAATLAAEHQEQMTTLAAASEEQVKTWQAAIAERDEKIRSLDSTLAETRKRLEEAITKLKEAGAR